MFWCTARFSTRFYFTSLGGFDTHRGQKERHDKLMAELNDAASTFYKDLKAQGHKNLTVQTETRYQGFKEFKDKHPEWTQAKVAMEYQKKTRDYVSGDTVRNVYRAKGKKFKRGGRIR